MNETVNLHLPQFEATDRIHHDDFNDAFAAIDAACGGIPKIALGQYVGNGRSGSSSPNSITFPFTPKWVMISDHAASSFAIWREEFTYFDTHIGAGLASSSATTTLSGNTLSWFADTYSAQLNGNNQTYYYIAIG